MLHVLTFLMLISIRQVIKKKKLLRPFVNISRVLVDTLFQVCTFGTEASKSAIRTAARGLGIEDETAGYISSLIPAERGIQLSLSQCYHGDDEHKPIAPFVESMKIYPKLWEVASRIEGVITHLGIHAAGVLITNEPIVNHNSIMKTSKGVEVTAYDLHDSEWLGGLKYDWLSVDGIGKIRTAMNYLLQDDVIKWQGSLKATYKKIFMAI